MRTCWNDCGECGTCLNAAEEAAVYKEFASSLSRAFLALAKEEAKEEAFEAACARQAAYEYEEDDMPF